MVNQPRDTATLRIFAIASIIIGTPLALYGVVFLMQNIGNAADLTPDAFTLFVGVFWLVVSFFPLSLGIALAGVGIMSLVETVSPQALARFGRAIAFCKHVLIPILTMLVGTALLLVGVMGHQVVDNDLRPGEYVFYLVGPLLIIFGALLLLRVDLAWLGRSATALWGFLADKNLGFLVLLIPALVALITYAFLSQIIQAVK